MPLFFCEYICSNNVKKNYFKKERTGKPIYTIEVLLIFASIRKKV